jgi:hypothetical protein
VFDPVAPFVAGIPKRHYGILNHSRHAMAFGLVQRLTAGEQESVLPVSLAVLSPGAPAELIPDEDIVVWSDTTTAAGTIVPVVPPHALVIPWRGQRWQCCCYDVNRNAFTWIGGR